MNNTENNENKIKLKKAEEKVQKILEEELEKCKFMNQNKEDDNE